MRTPTIIGLMMWGVLSSGCGATAGEQCPPGTICECGGDLTVTVHLTNVPAKLQLRWKGHIVVDECAAIRDGVLLYEKRSTELVINDGGFGYTPPSAVDLEVIDLRDCIQAPESLLNVVDKAVPGAPFKSCSRASLDL